MELLECFSILTLFCPLRDKVSQWLLRSFVKSSLAETSQAIVIVELEVFSLNQEESYEQDLQTET